MLSRLFPSVSDFTYRGQRAALWILGVVLLLELVTGGAAVFNGYQAASAADGFALAEYSPQGAQAVVALFGALGVTQILVCVLGAIVLARYRALVPLFLLFLVLEFLARKGVAYFNPIARAPGNVGFWLNWALFVALCTALALSLKERNARLQAMDALPCCKGSAWSVERDLGRAEGFELQLGKCARCGTPWMNVFCGASGVTGFEAMAPDDVARIRSTADGPELKELMRQWGAKNL